MKLKKYFTHIRLCSNLEHTRSGKSKNLFEGLFFKFRKLHHVEMIITTKCNLRCKHCSNLIPDIQDKAKHISLEEFKRELDLLMSNFDYIYRLQIHGGEPLLHPEIVKIMAYVVRYKEKIGISVIVTNGTNLPSQELLNVISRNNVAIIASPYGFNETMLVKLGTVCFKNHVLYMQFGARKWLKFDPPDTKDYSIAELKSKYWNCPNNGFPAYKNGKLYLCARLANLLDYQENPVDDGVNLNSRSKNNSIRFLMKDYSINCKYCNINKKEMCNAAEQRTEEQLTIVSSKKSSIFEAKQW